MSCMSTSDMNDASTTVSAALEPCRHDEFPFLELPAELREQIYYYAARPILPIDTAAIPGTPDCVLVPAVAQLSRQTRREALHVRILMAKPRSYGQHRPYLPLLAALQVPFLP